MTTVAAKEASKGKLRESRFKTEKGHERDQEKEMQIVHETVKSEIRKRPAKKNKGIVKEYRKAGPFCRVTFGLSKEAVGTAKKVSVVGDFNNWDKNATLMKRLRNGDFEVTIDLAAEREYKFRYLLDDSRWENDSSADRYTPNPYGCDDSVVIV